MQNNDQKQIAGAIIIAGIIIAGAILLKGNNGAVGVEKALTNLAAMNLRPVSADEHIVGDLSSKVVIVEYSDTECPFCKVFQNTLRNTVSTNNNEVSWIYRHYPIAELHPKAFHEAVATECAWEQGGNNAFWKYIDEVFARTESNNKLDVKELPKIAADIGLNVSSFNNCLASDKYAAKIKADMTDGIKAGAIGTPYSIIIAKNNITAKKQSDIMAVVPKPDYNRGERDVVSFDTKSKNTMSMNGALPGDMVKKIIDILLK